MDQKKFQPYIPANQVMPEFTVVSVVLGALLAIMFGAANAYLGLRVGMTVSASIPAAVISMGIIRKVLKRDSILENNMVQTIGSAGESVAAGAIFTLPALFMWAQEGIGNMPNLIEIGLIALCGGVLGVLLMVPLRSALIVKEHGVLTYPEGQACAQVLIAGEEGGAKASTVFAGLGIAAGYKFIADGLKLFPSEVDWAIPAYKGSGIGMDVLPALAGVGYICGTKVSSYLFAGGTLAWFVIMPLIALFGNEIVLFPADQPVGVLFAEGGPWALWKNYVKYIGAGAVAAGGIMSLLKSLPLIFRTFKEAVGDYGKRASSTLRTEQDLPMKVVALGVLLMAVMLWLIPAIPLNLFSAFIVIVFGFFFATVSSRPGFRHGDCNAADFHHAAQVDRYGRRRGHGLRNCHRFADLHHCRNRRRYLAGFEDRLPRRFDTAPAADRRADWLCGLRSCHRRHSVSAQCSMGLRRR